MKFIRILIAAIIVALTAVSAMAASSQWKQIEGARLRLIMVPALEGNGLRAGLDIDLEKGWKTYWRNPGQSGIPPQIGFFGSKNVKHAEVMLPAPELFDDGKEIIAGYKGRVVFPMKVIPGEPGEPVTLNVNGLIGICADICVPVAISLSVTSSDQSGTSFEENSALLSGFSKLPKQPTDKQQIVASSFDKKKRQILVHAAVPENAHAIHLLVEGPAEWYLQPGKLRKREGGKARFAIDLIDLPRGANVIARPLRYTLVADGLSIEQTLATRAGN